MAGRARWVETARSDGVLTIKVRKWAYFSLCLSKYMQSITGYVYRGQANATWLLEPSLDRLLYHSDAASAAAHLEAFKLAARGRRGPNPPVLKDDNDWWALGQHHGLATPLLDWTTAPYVAAYFAFLPPDVPGVKERCIFGLQARLIGDYCNGECAITGVSAPIKPPGGVELPLAERIVSFAPQSDENARLVSQGGLFTRGPAGIDYESWVRKHFAGVSKGLLVKLVLPTTERFECLQSLNRMNINHLSLFPDLYGASKHCNTLLKHPSY